MALCILRELAANIQSTKFTITVDESTDVSITEQLVTVLCRVDQSLEFHKNFGLFYATDSFSGDSLVSIIKDVLST